MRQANRLIISLEFTTDSSARTLRFQRVCTSEVEEERKEAEGNPNGVVYAVAVKTDVEIIVGNLLRQISSLFSVSAFERYNCVRGHRLGASVSRWAKRRLVSLCTLQHSWEKLRIWNENYPIMVKQQHVYSTETFQQSSSVCPD